VFRGAERTSRPSRSRPGIEAEKVTDIGTDDTTELWLYTTRSFGAGDKS
jgi:hypothetical protein